MDRVSRKSEKRGLSIQKLYDVVVFVYIIAIFVLENAKYSQVFSVIQIVFFGFSILMLGRYIKLSFCLKWCISILAFSFILVLLNYNSETSTTLIVVLKNVLKCFFIFTYMDNEEKIEKVIRFVGIAGILCGLVLLSEFVTSGMSYDNLKHATVDRIGADIAGGNVNIVAMDMCIAFVSWLYLLGKTEKRSMKLFVLCIMAFILMTSLLTGSRKILFFFVVTFVIANLQNNKRNLIFVIGGLAALYIAVMEIEPLYYLVGHKLDFFGDSSAYKMYDSTNQNRVQLIEKGLEIFADNPWGIGFGNTKNFINSYTHNNYVEVLASLGVFGFILYYSAYFYPLSICLKNKDKQIARYVIYSIIGFLLLEFSQVTYMYSAPMVFLAVVMSISEKIKNHQYDSDEAHNRISNYRYV